MSRMVMCARLKHEAEGLQTIPFPGALGQEIFDKVSAEAFEEWKEMQIKIINEYRLDLSEPEHRQMLLKQMRAFLGLSEEEVVKVGTPN